MSNDSENRHLSRVVVVPLTSNADQIYPGKDVIKISGKAVKAMADQIMADDKSRLKNLLGSLSKKDMLAFENAIKIHLAFPL